MLSDRITIFECPFCGKKVKEFEISKPRLERINDDTWERVRFIKCLECGGEGREVLSTVTKL
jgi:hypothetical protein